MRNKRCLWFAVLAFGLGGSAVGEERAAVVLWPEGLTSGEPARLASFYEKTLGWTSERRGEGEHGAVIFLRAGRPVAGLSHRAAERRGPARSRWAPVFAVGAVAETEAAVLAAGGRSEEEAAPGSDVPDAAELPRWLSDAEGAVFGLAREPGAGGGVAVPGVWPVLLTRDTLGAAELYRGWLGGRVRGEERTPLFPGDFVLEREGRVWAGVQPCGSFGRAGWLLMFSVGDIENATKQAWRAGGQILRAPELDLIGGRVAVLADPAGGVFGLYEALPLGAKDGRAVKEKSGAAAYEVEALR